MSTRALGRRDLPRSKGLSNEVCHCSRLDLPHGHTLGQHWAQDRK